MDWDSLRYAFFDNNRVCYKVTSSNRYRLVKTNQLGNLYDQVYDDNGELSL